MRVCVNPLQLVTHFECHIYVINVNCFSGENFTGLITCKFIQWFYCVGCHIGLVQ